MTSDEQTRSALSRLTENERECLRRRLLPQTAKEMARDLGISPHAVEKRLKMARTKLGLSSSLEAARLLAASEEYQPLVPRRPYLSGRDNMGEVRAVAAPPSGAVAYRLPYQGLLMLMLLALLAFVAQDVPAADPPQPPMKTDDGRDVTSRKVGMDEAATFNREGFADKDRNHSGDLDPIEASAMEPRNRYRDASLPAPPSAGARDPAGERKWMDLLDHNRDGRVSVEEYVSYMMAWTLWTGVPDDWHKRR
jgi:DNA-binding CsgD family transcriptional regulator